MAETVCLRGIESLGKQSATLPAKLMPAAGFANSYGWSTAKKSDR
nr:hypothetical protein [Petrachloros mirabilis]